MTAFVEPKEAVCDPPRLAGETREMEASRPLVEALTNPAAVYPSPSALLADPDLSPLQKRAALSGWARDALALQAVAADAPELLESSRLDEVLDALERLDGAVAQEYRRALGFPRGEGERKLRARGRAAQAGRVSHG